MTSHSEFNEKTLASDVAATYPSRVKDRTVLITGVSPKGIGGATALAFASQSPALLILASRTPANIASVVSSINEKHPSVAVRSVTLDLSSQASVRACAEEVKKLTPTLDLLINNAGITGTKRFATAEGIEGQFGTNHIGPFLLTNLLVSLLEAAAAKQPAGATRVVNLASEAHRLSPVRFHDIDCLSKEVPPEEMYRDGLPAVYLKGEGGYLGVVAYAQSKTANILFTAKLQDLVKSKGISSYAVHPGGVKTELGRSQDDDVNDAISKIPTYWKNIDEGASTTMVAALDPALDKQVGLYMDHCQFKDPAPHASNPAAADKLWTLSEELVKEKFSGKL